MAYTDLRNLARRWAEGGEYGAKGFSISPGTKKGDSYCARSAGQMKKTSRGCRTEIHCDYHVRSGSAQVKITKKVMPNVGGKNLSPELPCPQQKR